MAAQALLDPLRITALPRDNLRRRTGDAVAIGGDYQYLALTQGPRVQRFWHDTKLWLARRYLQPRPGDHVIDIGCGSGVVAASIAELPVRECVGVDGNAAAVAFASRRFQRHNLRFIHGLADELAFADDAFDAACCMELIEHIYPEQGQTLLRRIHRIVKPGGRLLITTPNYRSAWPLIEWMLDRSGKVPRLAEDQHVAFYNHSLLRRTAAECGWRTVLAHSCCTLAPWLAAVHWRLAEFVRRREARIPFGTIMVHLLEKPLSGPEVRGEGH